MLGRGDLLAGYRIDDIVGVGGMAIVYRAEQVSLGRRVALKVLSPQLSRDEAFRERFRREGKHAAGLHHPNVVTIFNSGEADGRLFIAMLLVEGSTLADRMAGESLSADETELSACSPATRAGSSVEFAR
jgi:serine/threonine protein kinase